MVQASRIADDLRSLGLAAGDTIMLHVSLRRVGPVEGGAVGLVHAIESVLGPDGTLMMILGDDDPWAWVNERPMEERSALLADAEPFDSQTAPVLPEVGMLAEVVRTMPGTLVNDNPEGRFAARGARASQLIEHAPWDDYYGPDSPLDRLVQIGGKVLRLGANLDTVTGLHHAEYLAHVENKRRVWRLRKVMGPDGPELRVITCLDDEHGIVDDDFDEDYFAIMLKAYLATGRGSRGVVGSATSELIDAADIVAFGVEWMSENLHA